MQVKPEIGMGVTYHGYSDSKPYTVIAVHPQGRRCTIQEDIAVRTDNNGMSDCQTYDYTPNPEGQVIEISVRKDGRWRQVGRAAVSGTFVVGKRRKYHDYSF